MPLLTRRNMCLAHIPISTLLLSVCDVCVYIYPELIHQASVSGLLNELGYVKSLNIDLTVKNLIDSY